MLSYSLLSCQQTELCELREEAAELRAQKFQADAKMRQLEAAAVEQSIQPVSHSALHSLPFNLLAMSHPMLHS